MTRRAWRQLTLAVTLAGATLACRTAPDAVADGSPGPARPDVLVLTDTARQHAGIGVESAQTLTRTTRLFAPGLIALDETRTARVGSLQEGLILETLAQVGDRVRTKQLLATLHGHAMHDAWAGYRKALAERRKASHALAFAVDAHERAKRLYADKAVSLQELQRADVDRVAATQAVHVAQAEVTRSVEELEHVGVTVAADATEEPASGEHETTERIPVRSPLSGVVLERLVTPGTTVVPGTPLFVVSDLSTLWAIAEIDEGQLSRVRVGSPVDVAVAAYPDERFSGRITFIADTVSPRTRRITVRSTVPNADGRLKPEMFATIGFGEMAPRAALVVPATAVQMIDGASTVFVAVGQGRFAPRRVQLGAETDGLIEVSSGLSSHEPVVTTGSFVLKSELLKSTGDQ